MLPVHWICVKPLHLGCELVRFCRSHVCGKSYSIIILFLNDLYTFKQDMLLFKTSRWNTRVFICIFKVQTALKVCRKKKTSQDNENQSQSNVQLCENETNNILTFMSIIWFTLYFYDYLLLGALMLMYAFINASYIITIYIIFWIFILPLRKIQLLLTGYSLF